MNFCFCGLWEDSKRKGPAPPRVRIKEVAFATGVVGVCA